MTEVRGKRDVSAQFSISMPSRHPANQKGDEAYDRENHQYRQDYVKPKFWILQLSALYARHQSERDDGVFEVPNDLLSFKWSVRQIDGPFSQSIIEQRSPRMGRVEFKVPAAGEYEISLQVNLRNGRSVSSTQRYRFRDFLVVSIGDSFASGEGNPDTPAIPSVDEKLACKAATLKIFYKQVEKYVQPFLLPSLELNKFILKSLPFVGGMAASGIALTEDAAKEVLGWALKFSGIPLGITIAKGVAGGFVEGAEAVLGLFGVGDGGEFDEVIAQKARWIEEYAHRSYRSGHSLAAREAEDESYDRADRITFLSFARSGSEIKNGLLEPRAFTGIHSDTWIGDIGQIEEVRRTVADRTIDALVITIGGNDIGFAGALTGLVLNDNFILGKLQSAGGNDAFERKLIEEKAIKEINTKLSSHFDSLKKAIDTKLHPRKVFITEYPTGLFTKFDSNGQVINDRPGGVFDSWFDLDLTKEDGKTVRRVGEKLNQLIRSKADEYGWVYVSGIDQGFAGHGYSAQRPYIVGAEESCRTQKDFEGHMHPNKDGHNVYRDYIARALHKHIISPEAEWLEPVLFMMMN